MFLCTHKAIEDFAEYYLNQPKKSYSIVCERKEDIIAIRNQVFFEIEKRTKNPVVSGISMFTLDSLAKNYCATLSAITHQDLIRQIPESLFQPYLEVDLQEQFIELILNLFGYASGDSAALSKQILTLLDTPLPQDTNLVELILNTQEKEQSRIPIQQVHANSLKQILATFQQAKIEFTHYARFQTLTKEYLSGLVFDHIQDQTFQNHMVLPKNILKSSMLWIEAPRYLENKPGHFQRSLVDEFKNSIVKTRDILGFHENSFYLESRTILDSPKDIDSSHIHFRFSENEQDFFHRTKKRMEDKSSKQDFVLLADFDPNEHFSKIRSDAGGSYVIHKKDIEKWKQKKQDSIYLAEAGPQIDKLFDQFITLLSFFHHEDQLHRMGTMYGLPTTQINEKNAYELFQLFATKGKIKIQGSHPASHAPKALSFFCTENLPSKITLLGRIHAPVASSFNVKILNNAILLLKEKGVDIELPASDIVYKEFWKHMISLKIPMEFWLSHKKELEDFPKYFTPTKNICHLNFPLPKAPSSHLAHAYEQNKLVIPHWQTEFSWKKNHISVTQFEVYVACPLQFFLTHVLKLQKEIQDEFEINHMDVGSRMHQICEQLMTRLVTQFGNEDYLKIMPTVYETLIFDLKQESVFLSFEKSVFEDAVKKTIKSISLESKNELLFAFLEAIENIWDEKKTDTKSHLIFLQEREILKRCFLKFLQIELKGIQSGLKKKVGVAREFPLSFQLSDFKLSAKIDRIDINHDGCEIIDYKTSKIPNTEKDLTLLPSEAKSDPKLKFSAQGGLYSYGWTKSDHLDIESELHSNSEVSHFSLYRMKNLDETANPILQFSFPKKLKIGDEFYQKLESEYTACMQSLIQGDFNPNPIQGKVTCSLCSHALICPYSP
jgi:hypothetical protein